MCDAPLTLVIKERRDSEHTRTVPCGNCTSCLKTRANKWSFRLYHQALASETSCFITLTYGENYSKKTGELIYGNEPDNSPSGLPTLNKKHLQDFIKRLRKYVNTNFPGNQKLKYYAVGEYGSQYARPHYHLIMFNLPIKIICRSELLQNKIWKHGQADIAVANIASMAYVAGYLNKESVIYQNDDRKKEFSLMSKGLGATYLTDAVVEMHLDRMETFVMHPSGFKMPMPRYHKEKIFSKLELKAIQMELERAYQIDWNEFANIDYKPIVERTKMKQYQSTKKLLETRKTF